MTHQLKYYSDWHDANGVLHRVEFLQKDFTGTASEILLASFKVNYPEINLFEDDILIGGGASFQIITPSPLALIDDFYIVDPFGMQVRHYIYDSHEFSNYVTNFIGYIDTEQFEDPISDGVNYEIHVSANNGVAILDRMPITFPKQGQEEGKEAIISVIELLKHCFDKLQIDFDSFKVNIGTKLCPYPIPRDRDITEDHHPYRGQPLHNIFVDRSNYYDEKENATSCRDSISQCLMPFYCKVVIYDNIIYILDMQSLRKTDTLELSVIDYDTLVFTPESSTHEELPNNLFSIDERVEAHNVSMSSGKNKVSIRLNKYTQKNPYEVPLDGNTMSGFIEKVPIYSDDGVVSGYEHLYGKAEGFQILPQDLTVLQSPSHNHFVKKVGSGAHSSSAEYFIRLVAPKDRNDSSFRLQVDTGLFITSAHQFIGLDMDVMFEDASKSEEYSNKKAYPRTVILPCLLSKKDGDCTNPDDLKAVYDARKGKGWIYSWKDPSKSVFKDGVTFGEIITEEGISNSQPGISFTVREFGGADRFIRMNKWYKINGNIVAYKSWVLFYWQRIYSFLFPINNSFINSTSAHPGGFLSFVFYVHPEAGINVYLIKNIKVHLLEVQEDQTDPVTGYNFFDTIKNTDVEFEGRSSLDFANELFIETNQGTASSNFSRASFFVYTNKPYFDCPDFDASHYRWVRAEKFVRGKNVGNLEKLLLNSYLSNLKVSRYKLTVDLKGYFPFYKNFEFPMLKRNGQNVKLIPTSMSVDYETGISSFTMEEYNKEDSLNRS